MSTLTPNGVMNGRPEASAESNSANGEAEKAFTTSARAASPRSGRVGGRSLKTGLPTESPDESQSMRRQKDRIEIKMFWALAKTIMRKWGGQLIEFDSHGVKYLALAFPRNCWQKEIADGHTHWMPTEIADAIQENADAS